MTMLTCKIPHELDARLDELARQTKTPKAKVVRKVLEQAVQKRSRNGTAFALVKDLCGSLSGVPTWRGTRNTWRIWVNETRIIVDTGSLVAFLVKEETRHVWVGCN